MSLETRTTRTRSFWTGWRALPTPRYAPLQVVQVMGVQQGPDPREHPQGVWVRQSVTWRGKRGVSCRDHCQLTPLPPPSYCYTPNSELGALTSVSKLLRI